jgi:YidC/Oxa1 family membrane protein insertase
MRFLDMGHDKRILIAFVLSFAVLLLWRVILPPPPAPPKTAAPAQARPATSQPGASGQVAAVPIPPPAPVALPVATGSKAETIVVENDLYRVTFSTQGAVAKSWLLKKYQDEKGQSLDVVNGAACEQLGFPMSLSLADQGLQQKVNEAVYVANPASASLAPPVKLDFTYSDGKIRVQKQFSFGPGFEVRAEVGVFDGQHYLPVEVTWPGGFGDHTLPAVVEDSLSQAAYGSIGNLTTVAQKKVKEDRLVPGPLEIAGMEDRYFADIFLPGSPDQAFRVGRRVWTPSDWKGKDSDKPQPMIAMLGSAQPKPLEFRMFVGPKDLDVLRTVKPPLDSLVDFGWFSIVAKPLFLGLRYLYDHWVHNYGWAIVLLTIFINFAMFPLKLKSIRSAQEMQRIAPLVKSIQDKYKQYKFKDPRKQRMNQEVMKLYQEHHINPLGGCLPMLLQLPFLYGFYRVLELPIELRHAPWIGWIKDLAAPDKFHPFGIPIPILPTVMVISMFALQKITPMATADPAQQRMMMIMPIVFGIMFYNFASGLVLYFLTANLVGIAQQLLINKIMPGPQLTPVPRKTAEVRQ